LVAPLYHQTYLLISERIRRGEFEHGAKLPTEVELCKTYGVSRITIRRTLRELAHDNLVSAQQGVGTFVRSAIPLPPSPPASLDEYFEMAASIKGLSDWRLLHASYIAPPESVRAIMECFPRRRGFAHHAVTPLSGHAVRLPHRVRAGFPHPAVHRKGSQGRDDLLAAMAKRSHFRRYASRSVRHLPIPKPLKR